jgi:WD40 repeat protein
VLYLKTRALKHPEYGNLVSAGGDGKIRFWNITTGSLLHEELCANSANEGIYAMTSDESNSILLIGDSAGYVVGYDLSGNFTADNSKSQLSVLTKFHAHISTITDIAYIQSDDVVVTANVDCSIRLFKVHLHLI